MTNRASKRHPEPAENHSRNGATATRPAPRGRRAPAAQTAMPPGAPAALVQSLDISGMEVDRAQMVARGQGITRAADKRPSAAVFGQPGAPVEIGRPPQKRFLANLSLFGARDAQEFINYHYPARWKMGGETVGHQIVEACTAAGEWESLHGIIQWGIHDGHQITLEDMGATDPRTLIDVINHLFAQPGIAWLERVVKTSGAAAEEYLMNEIRAKAPELAAVYLRALGLDETLPFPADGGTTSASPSSTS